MPADSLKHVPVLREEVLSLLAPMAGETFVDLTLGAGGHAEAVGRVIGPTGTIVGFDLDSDTLAASGDRLQHVGPAIRTLAAGFDAAPSLLREHGLRADMVLADLGFSSAQMDDPARGFSFRGDGPLDMRFDRSAAITAADIVNQTGQRDLADLISRFGEDPLARKIAAAIVESRRDHPILTTAELERLVFSAYGRRARSSRVHPATRTFMALRIAVNDELGRLESVWEAVNREARRPAPEGSTARTGGDLGGRWLSPDARIAFISFHSLEDRIIKNAAAALVRDGLAEKITRKPVTASPPELESNPRARSAKLRVIRLRPILAVQ